VSILEEMPNIEVLSLVLNKISTLKHFARCSKLRELYLRRNLISDLNELRYIEHLPNLKTLWLVDNPCTAEKNYRLKVIARLKHLEKLDDKDVSIQERQLSESNFGNYGMLEIEDERPQRRMEEEPKMQRYDEPKMQRYDEPPRKYENELQVPDLPPVCGSPDVPKRSKWDIPRDNVPMPKVHNDIENQTYIYDSEREKARGFDYKENRYELEDPSSKINVKGQVVGNRNNILVAVLSLIKELDAERLNIVKNEIDKQLSQM
jgi:Leucine-rich repeat (LRR) protein